MLLVIKNQSANTGVVRDGGLIPGSTRFPGGGHGTYSSILPWRIPWTEEPGGLQSMGSQSQTRLKQFNMHTHIVYMYINSF